MDIYDSKYFHYLVGYFLRLHYLGPYLSKDRKNLYWSPLIPEAHRVAMRLKKYVVEPRGMMMDRASTLLSRRSSGATNRTSLPFSMRVRRSRSQFETAASAMSGNDGNE